MGIVSDDTSRGGVVALVGNPRPGSRTLVVAQRLAAGVAGLLNEAADPVTTLDLAEIAGQLLIQEGPDADRYRAVVASAAVAVIATPVYKASYTGLLKAFVDRYPAGALRGVLAVPVVVSASPAHSFVGEHLLRPLLVELGATVPVPSFAVVEGQLDDLQNRVDGWLEQNGEVLSRLALRADAVGVR